MQTIETSQKPTKKPILSIFSTSTILKHLRMTQKEV